MSDIEIVRAGDAHVSLLRYRVAAARPAAHIFDVTLDVPAAKRDELRLRLPAWIPGSYMVRDYARHVVTLTATDADATSLVVQRASKSEWLIAAPGDGPIQVNLQVYGWDLSVRGSHLDQHHAYFNGACLFPEILGYTGSIRVEIDRPAGLPANAWVATSMAAFQVDEQGFGEYGVADYDELLDHPVEIAEQQSVAFSAAGLPHRFVVRGAPPLDEQRLITDCEAVCDEHHALLGTPADFDRYTFLAYALDSGYGGLEHRWSSSLAVSYTDLPLQDRRRDDDAYRKFLGLVSHEYFHLWNVRRLKPAVFTPMDMSREVHTGLLWVFEGITSYYDDLALARSGVISSDEYLQLIGQIISRVQRTPGRLVQSLEHSSFDAWSKFYKQDENAPNSIVSYYAKGAVAALALDLKLRAESKTTLDAVMRECWQRFYLADGAGMPERGLEGVAAELSGLDLREFFDVLIRGTQDVDLAALFAPFGVAVNFRATGAGTDAGGQAAENLPSGYAGLKFDPQDSARIAHVFTDGPAQRAGLSAGDRLVAVDGIKTDRTGFERLLDNASPSTTFELHVFRRDRLITLSLSVAEPPLDTVWLSRDSGADAEAKRRFEGWQSSLCV